MGKKVGRKQKPYETSWGEVIPGLAYDTDKRWRIVATGKKFREEDERAAVDRFMKMQGNVKPIRVVVTADVPAIGPGYERPAYMDDPRPPHAQAILESSHALFASEKTRPILDAPVEGSARLSIGIDPDNPDSAHIGYDLDPRVLIPYMRWALTDGLERTASLLNMPQLLALRSMKLPAAPVKITDVIASYKAHSTATDKSKNEALAPFNDLVNFANARSLADLTEERLIAYRADVVARPNLKSSGTITAYFNRCRSVLKKANRGKVDGEQLAAARC